MKKNVVILSIAVFLLSVGLIGCQPAKYVKSELAGTAKPDGGIQETIPTFMTFNVAPKDLRRATLEILDEQGYIYEENPSTGTIKTEPKPISGQKKGIFVGANYSVKLFIKLSESTVTYRTKFDKSSNLTMAEQNIEFPDKENELRKEFFAMLNQKLGISIGIK